jgi:hypothetical protein
MQFLLKILFNNVSNVTVGKANAAGVGGGGWLLCIERVKKSSRKFLFFVVFFGGLWIRTSVLQKQADALPA